MRGEQGDENAGRASGVSLAWARGMKKTTSRSKSTTPGSDSKRSVLEKVTLTAGACLLIVFTIIGMEFTLHGSHLSRLQGVGRAAPQVGDSLSVRTMELSLGPRRPAEDHT